MNDWIKQLNHLDPIKGYHHKIGGLSFNIPKLGPNYTVLDVTENNNAKDMYCSIVEKEKIANKGLFRLGLIH